MEEEKVIIDKKKLYDDCYYPVDKYIEHPHLVNKTDLFDAFSTDIIARYTHYCSSQPQIPPMQPSLNTSTSASMTEMRIGYILYMEADSNINIKNKMNKLLNYMIQLKNPNIYVKSHWEIVSVIEGVNVGTGTGTMTVNKIKIKVIVLENNKDFAIKMLIGELVYNMKKRQKI